MTSQVRRQIRLVEEEGGWSAIDESVGVPSAGGTREEALEMLDEAVARQVSPSMTRKPSYGNSG